MIQTLEDMLQACILDFKQAWDQQLALIKFSYNNSYHASIGMALYEALYGRRCRTPLCWQEIGDALTIGPESRQLPRRSDNPRTNESSPESTEELCRLKAQTFGV